MSTPGQNFDITRARQLVLQDPLFEYNDYIHACVHHADY
jgi:hypothetical protein